ncbi:GAF domain-containing protein [Aestuariispira insulae]|uniref:Adenylate cyclase n=1 Tax=Aestuariispira insulae TaxID=1461337 RepID=A0A3D9H9P7_9PROT|nr:GAF domain-containing protein [Aestuariispira insulae]RED46214.1 adenylate cyclase [Aestuariispira insulae]
MARKQAALSAQGDAGSARLQYLEMLLNVSRQVAAEETLDAMLTAITENAVEQTGSVRGSLFLNDPKTHELYSRITLGEKMREIRILNSSGIAGAVFQTGVGEVVNDAYSDPRFNKTVDNETGFTTKQILCAPVRTPGGKVIGVIQTLNKEKGDFDQHDLELLEMLTSQCAVTLQSAQQVEHMELTRAKEMEFLNVVSDITSEIDLSNVLQKVMVEATRMLDADRGTLFLNDAKTAELFSKVAMGDSIGEIRLPNHLGIAGKVFTTRKTVNIPYAYADLQFNPAFDKQTGYFTRSILCVPVVNKEGDCIGVTQVLNKKNGTFTEEDESRLKAFTAQVSIALENAKLFDDVQRMQNYNQNMLESMSNGVVTLDEKGHVVTCNAAGLSILHTDEEGIVGRDVADFLAGENDWVLDRIARVRESSETEIAVDAELHLGGETISVNLSVLPLMSQENDEALGSMLMIEDISSEKRMKSTMSRYMDPGLADQLLESGEEMLGGRQTESTVLFSDVRSFTTITETLGAQGTVSLLNEYFTIMVDCITREGGMLDKFIGDAIMAGFGIPLPHEDDEDRAMRAAIAMISELREWNIGRRQAGELEIDMGIGLNTDKVVSGNIGSPKRMDYTMIGDGVNLAARLESACKQYKARILISENTKARLHGTYRMREVDLVVVKGKTKPVSIFEVLDYYKDEEFPNLMDVVGHFNEGVIHYRKQEWDQAKTSFHKALKANAEDALSNIYLDRVDHMLAEPPGDDWDGVWVMTSK